MVNIPFDGLWGGISANRRGWLIGSKSYVSLELPDVRAAAAADPRGFLELHSPPVILDEVQYAPDLLPYIKDSQLLEEVAQGEEIIITKHGVPVAALVPVAGPNRQDPQVTIDAIKAFRRGRHLAGLSIREIVEEGRL